MLTGEKGTYYHMPHRYTMMIKRGMHVKRVCKIMSRNSDIFSPQIPSLNVKKRRDAFGGPPALVCGGLGALSAP